MLKNGAAVPERAGGWEQAKGKCLEMGEMSLEQLALLAEGQEAPGRSAPSPKGPLSPIVNHAVSEG